MTGSSEYDAVVIGGGFFGCSLALGLSRFLGRVLVVEKEPELLQRASHSNQARVHNGYHYPRSLLTALRSRVNFDRFVGDYAECVVDGFDKYYAIATTFSHVTAEQFRTFCSRIGAPLEPAPRDVRALFNPALIEDVFRVREIAFDAVKLRQRTWRDLRAAGLEVRLNTEAVKLQARADELIEVSLQDKGAGDQVVARYVFNCTYARLNPVLANSNLPTLPLKYELTEMALVDMPAPLKDFGVTVMCGPFFSAMPFPSRGLHTLSHVRYTPHNYWFDGTDGCRIDAHHYLVNNLPDTRFEYMIRDASRYMPALRDARHMDSLWEVKTVLPASEVDDSRPILFRWGHGLKNLVCVMGGKIDNIYDVLQEIDLLRGRGELS
ncbi:FAD-dependent oxidoreductase [Cystobacter fuscus]|uniref:FAD-dependent oxidoreductase n=1 Tax=Cystobacter fuscus TaxID=43 RepID=UPI0005BD349B|nr:FAD-dependent oxidoreductase [Cystobacter fuscus]